MNSNFRPLLLASTLMVPPLLPAAEIEQNLMRCAAIGDVSARLGCFDALAKASAAPVLATAAPLPASVVEAAPAVPAISRTVQRWELDDGAKRGVFTFRPHRDNYLILANYSSSSNDAPFTPVAKLTPGGIKAQHVELTYQLSFKMKLAERLAQSPVDLWFGYTQQSYWQAYNRAASSPFRETNYQPELMAVLPLRLKLAGFDVRYLNFGLVHQSNGQTQSLSRSWNRFYSELGVERGNVAVSARIWKRLDNAKSDNDNPDITNFLGSGELVASYRNDGHELGLTLRRNFGAAHGALQASWAFPVTANLKGYLQLFTGYGQSLIDYNYAQKSLGAGFLLDF